jgi:hypothetical protein
MGIQKDTACSKLVLASFIKGVQRPDLATSTRLWPRIAQYTNTLFQTDNNIYTVYALVSVCLPGKSCDWSLWPPAHTELPSLIKQKQTCSKTKRYHQQKYYQDIRINQYSTRTGLVWKTSWKNGMKMNNTRTESVNAIAINMYKFLVSRDPIGGCWKIDNRLVRVMRRLPHCINTNVTK